MSRAIVKINGQEVISGRPEVYWDFIDGNFKVVITDGHFKSKSKAPDLYKFYGEGHMMDITVETDCKDILDGLFKPQTTDKLSGEFFICKISQGHENISFTAQSYGEVIMK